MRDVPPVLHQPENSPETSSFIPAQFRPSSQLAWRAPILIASALCASIPVPARVITQREQAAERQYAA